ncbi:conserved hypothetical protein, membrane [mine drainage metagenome]|uniref:Isoprenylcysteine carboxylmethyltransferase family protein n=1 Tax=mine drainage metagenome TaxID=410659 RepID=T0ZES7_9ZZZZ
MDTKFIGGLQKLPRWTLGVVLVFLALVLPENVLGALWFDGGMVLSAVGYLIPRMRRVRKERRLAGRTPVLAVVLAVVWFFGMVAIWRLLPQLVSLPWALDLAEWMYLLGALLMVDSMRTLGSSWSLNAKPNLDSPVRTEGPYLLVRHPLYLGVSLFGIAFFGVIAGWPGMAATTLIVVPLQVRTVVHEEEALLRTPYTRERYAAYIHEVPRFLPTLRSVFRYLSSPLR